MAASAYEESLCDLIEFMVKRGDAPDRVAANVVKLNRMRDLLQQATPAGNSATAHERLNGMQP